MSTYLDVKNRLARQHKVSPFKVAYLGTVNIPTIGYAEIFRIHTVETTVDNDGRIRTCHRTQTVVE